MDSSSNAQTSSGKLVEQSCTTFEGRRHSSSCLRFSSSSRTCRHFTSHMSSGTGSGTKLLWCVGVLLVCLLSTPVYCVPTNNSSVEDSATTPPTQLPRIEQLEPYTLPSSLNIRECFQIFDTPDQVRYVCGQHPDMIPILMYAESVGKDACEKSFENDLWNCSGFSILKEPNITKGAVYKESTYVYALSVAVIAHSVAKACSQDLLKSCTCDDDLVDLPTAGTSEDVEYKHGCSDNVDYGLHVAELFLNKRYTSQASGSSLKQELIHHNFHAAKTLIRNIIVNTPVKCKCHGVSGSCTFKSCHSELPEINYVADQIRQKYDVSCQVEPNGHSDNSWVSKCDRDFTENDLLFRDEHNWCVVDPSVGSVGVIGRECDPHSEGPGSCAKLCRGCNRVPVRHKENVRVESDCSFHFCCEIRCNEWIGERTYYTCS